MPGKLLAVAHPLDQGEDLLGGREGLLVSAFPYVGPGQDLGGVGHTPLIAALARESQRSFLSQSGALWVEEERGRAQRVQRPRHGRAVAGCLCELDGLFGVLDRLLVAAAVDHQVGATPQRPRAQGSVRGRRVERLCISTLSGREEPPQLPVEGQGDRQPQRLVGIGLRRVLQRARQVRVLGGKRPQPEVLIGHSQMRLDLLGEGEQRVAVAVAHRLLVGRLA